MNLQIHTRNLELDQRLRDHAERKLSRLDHYLPHIAEIRLDLAQEHRREGNQPVAQVTIRNDRGMILRAEDKQQSDLFAAIDVAVDKMYRQISRYKGKRRRRTGDHFEQMEPDLAAAELPPLDDSDSEFDAEGESDIVRRKQITLTPMNEQEAIDQLELLGHTFFMFYNAETAKVNVIYKRHSGDYGLLEPTLG